MDTREKIHLTLLLFFVVTELFFCTILPPILKACDDTASILSAPKQKRLRCWGRFVEDTPENRLRFCRQAKRIWALVPVFAALVFALFFLLLPSEL